MNSLARALQVLGLLLTLAGAVVLSWFDLKGGGTPTIADVERGLPRTRAAWFAFPAVALGTALQVVATTLG